MRIKQGFVMRDVAGQAVVIATGIMGSMLAPTLIRLFKVRRGWT